MQIIMRLISAIHIRYMVSPLVGASAFFLSLILVVFLSSSGWPDAILVQSVPPADYSSPNPAELPSTLPMQIEQVIGENEPKLTQSAVVQFPRHGLVRVGSVEQVGEFPKIVFSDIRSDTVLYRSSITDDSDFGLKPRNDDSDQPFLRFREVRSIGLPSPLIVAVAIAPGGSDCGFYMSVFGEIDGKIIRLTNKPIDNAVQGGYYIGFLSQRLGYGIVSWTFDWNSDASEAHYDAHHYEMTVYKLFNGRFRKVLSAKSKRKYHPAGSSLALKEIGINAKDLRKSIPDMKDYVDVDD